MHQLDSFVWNSAWSVHSLALVAPVLHNAPAVPKFQHPLLVVVLGGDALAQTHHTLTMD